MKIWSLPWNSRSFVVRSRKRSKGSDKRNRNRRRGMQIEVLEERQLLANVLYWDPNQTNGANLGGSGTWVNGGSNAYWYYPAEKKDIVWGNAYGCNLWIALGCAV